MVGSRHLGQGGTFTWDAAEPTRYAVRRIDNNNNHAYSALGALKCLWSEKRIDMSFDAWNPHEIETHAGIMPNPATKPELV
jgi:hypothetical protein